MTVLECKLIKKLGSIGVESAKTIGIMSFLKKRKHQKMLLEFLENKDTSPLDISRLIVKVVEITEN